MSLSPSQEEAASSSPESPREGDFSSRQLYDNLESLEEHETCDDKRGPIVNNVPDNYSSSLSEAQICASPLTNDLENVRAGISSEEQIEESHSREPEDSSTLLLEEKLPDSPHFMEVCSLDGRFITLVSTETQTDWEKVEQSLSCSCRVRRKTGSIQMWQEEVLKDAVVVYLEDAGEKEFDRIHLGLPRVITCRREPKFPPRVLQLEIPGIKYRKKKVLPKKPPSKTLCQYCQQRNQLYQRYQRLSFIRALKQEVLSDRDVYHEAAKEFEEVLKKEKERLERKYTGTADELDTSMSINRQEWETEEEGWMKYVRREKKRRYETPGYSALPKEVRSDIPGSPEKTPSAFEVSRSPEEPGDEPRTTGVLQKFYKDGNIFLIKYLDGSGTVFYPSGNPAIVIIPAEDSHFIYIILEDKVKNRHLLGIFTPKGCATCYRPDGLLWLNITSYGGFCFDETGNLRRRWNWLYFDPHVHDLPFKPLIFGMGPCICIHIHSQKHVYVSFFHKDNHVRFSVGSELKFICPESHGEPGLSILERDIQLQKTKIYCLLDQMQICMSHPLANMQNIKPHFRFITRLEQLTKQVEQRKTLENTQPNEN
ncbi:uncharacterized protein LOC129361315 isoform X2 [Poeciliopsis prolifica]|uniref:uncharacterized protein LOC129361315 isoform X2 n=1 Tax=Poeciliopsis prolifica TaxID=188132 RepID=UPI0024134E1A|nr:uncharacterized protein LOC129361315 isoform X2 [Poeciliopsis prolifica]